MLMDFAEALNLMRQGKHLRREEWTADKYMFIHKESMYLGGKVSKSKVFGLKPADVLANDWCITK